MSVAEDILQLLARKPGLKAQEIANELGIERSQTVTALHGLLAAEVLQDNRYRWWPSDRGTHSAAAPAPRTFLANLCRYYLACMSRESASAVSIPASDSAGYVELRHLPFVPGGHLPAADRVVRRLVQRVRRERGQLTLYVGYALRVRSVILRNEEETRIDPVLLYPIEDTPRDGGAELSPVSGIPLLNVEVLRTMPSADSGNMADEAIQLSEELGLANGEEELPPWDEVIWRLQRCRPDWAWRETLDPYALSSEPSLAGGLPTGIYNRAILFAAPRSPFTYGLEVELRKLAQLDETHVRGTALELCLRGENVETPPAEDRPIVEVLPLNAEQRQAVVQGLSAPLTVVTGPPGTGKSQVVTSLLTNMAWQGESVLFSSKNNHAVDVVELRVNQLVTHPFLLRLGKEEHQARIAQDLSGVLAQAADPDAAARRVWLERAREQSRGRFDAVQREIAAMVTLRNEVDELERAAEPSRAVFGAERFARLLKADLASASGRIAALVEALGTLEPTGKGAVAQLLRDVTSHRRIDRIAASAEDARPDAELLGVAFPDIPLAEQNVETWRNFRQTLEARLSSARAVRAYGEALDRLRAARPIEQLISEMSRIAGESARDSLDLWRTWLNLRPSAWTAEERRLLSEYAALLQMIAGGDRYEEGAGRKVFQRYYSLFPKVTRVLPCWSVTALSARGRLPFEPGLFDLVVIDEASQCDIASALPLLFRARRAVIVGDPLQLRHVSTMAPREDRHLLAAHGLAEGNAAWAYSVNSLFDLSRSLCRREDLVNLRDHHRSHRDIINFSNRHFYRGGLRIATNHETLHRPRTAGPAVRWIDVRGKVARPSGGGAVNGLEAEAVVRELRTLMIHDGYNGAVGVVTPFRAQANRIRTMVQHDDELARVLATLHFVVDTVHGFQGDERDVMFFSPVVSRGVGEATLRFLKGHGNLFNVAVTRARSELIVVGDREAALNSGVSYLAGFAEYSRDLDTRDARAPSGSSYGPEYPPVSHPELVSDWERQFYKAMYLAGLRPVPQYEEGPYKLDFALFQGDRKLDIEIDGEHYHRAWDGELCRRDQIRSQRLHDLGWDILRLWVYQVRDDLNGSLGRVAAWANEPKPKASS
jgi:very-short-patch-repair endonuclease